MRLFFALWPDGLTRALFADAAAALRLPADARRVQPENFHATLAFAGEVGVNQLAMLLEIGRAQRAAACTLNVDGLDYWPDPQVVVALARAMPPSLIGLSTRLHQELALRLAAQRSRPVPPAAPLRAHVTLARKVAQAPVLQAMSPFHWSAHSFSLVRSDTSGAHSVYTVVDTWPLLDKTPTS